MTTQVVEVPKMKESGILKSCGVRASRQSTDTCRTFPEAVCTCSWGIRKLYAMFRPRKATFALSSRHSFPVYLSF
jgi:hypothetical protein